MSNEYIVVNTKKNNTTIWSTIASTYTPSAGEVCIIVPSFEKNDSNRIELTQDNNLNIFDKRTPVGIKIGDGTTVFRDLPTLTDISSIHPDWDETDTESPNYIWHKPLFNDDIFTYDDNVSVITVSFDEIVEARNRQKIRKFHSDDYYEIKNLNALDKAFTHPYDLLIEEDNTWGHYDVVYNYSTINHEPRYFYRNNILRKIESYKSEENSINYNYKLETVIKKIIQEVLLEKPEYYEFFGTAFLKEYANYSAMIKSAQTEDGFYSQRPNIIYRLQDSGDFYTFLVDGEYYGNTYENMSKTSLDIISEAEDINDGLIGDFKKVESLSEIPIVDAIITLITEDIAKYIIEHNGNFEHYAIFDLFKITNDEVVYCESTSDFPAEENMSEEDKDKIYIVRDLKFAYRWDRSKKDYVAIGYYVQFLKNDDTLKRRFSGHIYEKMVSPNNRNYIMVGYDSSQQSYYEINNEIIYDPNKNFIYVKKNRLDHFYNQATGRQSYSEILNGSLANPIKSSRLPFAGYNSEVTSVSITPLDEVKELSCLTFANKKSFPKEGEVNKIYIDLSSQNKDMYLWDDLQKKYINQNYLDFPYNNGVIQNDTDVLGASLLLVEDSIVTNKAYPKGSLKIDCSDIPNFDIFKLGSNVDNQFIIQKKIPGFSKTLNITASKNNPVSNILFFENKNIDDYIEKIKIRIKSGATEVLLNYFENWLIGDKIDGVDTIKLDQALTSNCEVEVSVEDDITFLTAVNYVTHKDAVIYDSYSSLPVIGSDKKFYRIKNTEDVYYYNTAINVYEKETHNKVLLLSEPLEQDAEFIFSELGLTYYLRYKKIVNNLPDLNDGIEGVIYYVTSSNEYYSYHASNGKDEAYFELLNNPHSYKKYFTVQKKPGTNVNKLYLETPIEKNGTIIFSKDYIESNVLIDFDTGIVTFPGQGITSKVKVEYNRTDISSGTLSLEFYYRKKSINKLYLDSIDKKDWLINDPEANEYIYNRPIFQQTNGLVTMEQAPDAKGNTQYSNGQTHYLEFFKELIKGVISEGSSAEEDLRIAVTYLQNWSENTTNNYLEPMDEYYKRFLEEYGISKDYGPTLFLALQKVIREFCDLQEDYENYKNNFTEIAIGDEKDSNNKYAKYKLWVNTAPENGNGLLYYKSGNKWIPISALWSNPDSDPIS